MNKLMVGLGLCLFLYPSGAEAAPCARVAVVMGRVIDGDGRRLQVGQEISEGGRVRSARRSLAKFLLRDDSVLDLGPETDFNFTRCAARNGDVSLDLELELGSVRAAVNKKPQIPREKFQIRTRASVLAVRGTELFASWLTTSDGSVQEQVGVKEGIVEVSSLLHPDAPPISVEGGQQLRQDARIETSGSAPRVVTTEPPKVDQFTASEQRQVEERVKIEDRVFQQSVEIPDAGKAESSAGKGQEARNFIFESVTGERKTEEKVRESETATRGPASQNSGERRQTVAAEKPLFSDGGTTALPKPASWEDSGFRADGSTGNVPIPGTAAGPIGSPIGTFQPTFIRLEVVFRSGKSDS